MTAATTEARAASPTNGAESDGTVVLDGITKRYGDQTAVDDLSLTIEPGEFISLLGPSGCGKTTTLRMIAGFEQPDAGDIRISGRSRAGHAALPARRQHGVPGVRALPAHVGRRERRLRAAAAPRRRSPRSASGSPTALDLVQMRRFADRKPTQLSGGQQQRVALARALVNRPSVLLLDEPLGALDRQLREEMQLELKLLQSRLGITFVFVTHDQGEALSMSDRIAVMRDGRIEQLADADTIYGAPASAYVAAFVGQQNFFDGRVTRGCRAVDSPHALVRRHAVRPSPPDSAARAAVRPEFVEHRRACPAAASATRMSHGASSSGSRTSARPCSTSCSSATDQSVIARRPTPDAPRLAVGDTVVCSWRAESVLLFPADDAAARGRVRRAPPTE